jgi:hypothetical protein
MTRVNFFEPSASPPTRHSCANLSFPMPFEHVWFTSILHISRLTLSLHAVICFVPATVLLTLTHSSAYLIAQMAHCMDNSRPLPPNHPIGGLNNLAQTFLRLLFNTLALPLTTLFDFAQDCYEGIDPVISTFSHMKINSIIPTICCLDTHNQTGSTSHIVHNDFECIVSNLQIMMKEYQHRVTCMQAPFVNILQLLFAQRILQISEHCSHCSTP